MKNPSIIIFITLFFISCTNRDAYLSCRNTLNIAIEEVQNVTSLIELNNLDVRINDTLLKYGYEPMTPQMIDDIKHLKELFIKEKEKKQKQLIVTDTTKIKIVEMPGIGKVELKAPPEV